MDRRTMGRACVGCGILVLAWAALSFTSASIGGRPEVVTFANRRPYNQVKRAAHAAFLPLVLRVALGMGLLVGGARLAGSANADDEPKA